MKRRRHTIEARDVKSLRAAENKVKRLRKQAERHFGYLTLLKVEWNALDHILLATYGEGHEEDWKGVNN